MLEQAGRRLAVHLAAVPHIGKQRAGHANQPQQFLIPLLPMNVEQQRARGVRHVGRMHAAARQAPQQEAIDGAEGQLAPLGTSASAGNMVEQPSDFRAGEIRIEQQPGALPHQLLGAVSFQPGANLRGAPVLPDDGPMNRRSAGAVPDHGGLALVGDADGGDVACAQAGLGNGLARRRQGVAPDIFRIVLHPACGGIVLRKFALCGRHLARLVVEHDAARGGRPLVDGEYVSRPMHVGILSGRAL